MAPEMFGASRRPTHCSGCVFTEMLIYVELFSECRVWPGLSSGIEIMQKVCGSYGTPPVMPKTDQLPLLYKNM